MPKLPPLRAVVVFEAAARHKSFKLAANEMRITPSAVSHNIATLEAFLEVTLFTRSARSVTLTNDGYKYSTLIGDVTRQIEWATAELAEQREFETITIQSLPTSASSWLAEHLKNFALANPEIDIRLRTNFTPMSQFDSTTDIVITYAEALSTGFVQKHLFGERILPFTSVRYWETVPGASNLEKLQHARLIHSDRSLVGWSTWADQNSVVLPLIRRGPHFDRGHLALEMAKSGFGIALESSVFAMAAVECGDLICPFPNSGIDLDGQTHKMLLKEGYDQTPHLAKLVTYLEQQVAISRNNAKQLLQSEQRHLVLPVLG